MKKIVTRKSAHARMLDDLRKSGLAREDAEQLGFMPCTVEECAKLNLSRAGDGYLLPYFDLDGKRLPMFRFRFFDTEVTSGFLAGDELAKYQQPAETNPEIYLPRLKDIDWLKIATDPAAPLFITEGEKKSACATKHGFHTIGLGGVYSFGRKARYQKLLPALRDDFKWAGRQAFICFDSDAITNQMVMTAEVRLARLLTDQGAYVRIVRLPQPGADKVCIDDYIVKHGADAFQELINSTEEYGPFEALHQLNLEVIHILHPSMVLEYPKENHPKDEPRYRMMPVAKFEKEVYADRKYWVLQGEKQAARSAAADWIEWPAHRKADSVTFAPGQPGIVDGQFNMWEGWGAKPVEGDVSLFHTLYDHMMQGMEPQHQKWLMQWFAYPIQNPGVRMNTAVVIWSNLQGSGKSILGLTFKGIYGQSFHQLNQRDIEGSFNSWMRYRLFVLGDEIAGKDSRGVADWLKSTITANDITINEKFIPKFKIRNRVNYYFTSNHQDAFYLENTDRRYFVWEVTAPPLPEEFFLKYGEFIESEAGRNALMHHFMNVDLTGFNPHAPAPETAAKREMKEQSRSAVEQWAVDLRDDPASKLKVGDVPVTRDIFTADELLSIYDRGDSVLKAKGMSAALKKAGFKRTEDSVEIPHTPPGTASRRRLWVIRNRERLEKLTDTEKAAHYSRQLGYKPKPGGRAVKP